jgi:hypothetical protein
MNFVRFFQNYGTVNIAYSYQSTREQVSNSPFSNEFLLNNASTSFENIASPLLYSGHPLFMDPMGHIGLHELSKRSRMVPSWLMVGVEQQI